MADDFEDDADDLPLVRPYSRTGGRTRSTLDLAIETLVSTSDLGRARSNQLDGTHQPIAELCAQSRSVAEIAALMRIPLGVARVLVSDMVGMGLVVVHQQQVETDAAGGVPLALMQRVLAGLHRL
ncbi:DUF742 domain-containing protein [Pseudonocardia humida]|uniref:DUF742 domain-containing protein n=1 Tax=Pseudonocardia humida TaxID=2800819 RepID=UPI00207C1388|nr:DUF742 domain-containing protein [Pseudonocardia humida]